MPCESGPEDTSWVGPALKAAKGRTDEVTRHLCFLCGTLEEKGLLKKFASKPLMAWWEEHQRADDKRVRAKMLAYCLESIRSLEEFEDLNADRVAERFIKLAADVHPVSDFHKNWFHEMAEELKDEAEDIVKREKSGERKKALRKLTPSERKALGIEAPGEDDDL